VFSEQSTTPVDLKFRLFGTFVRVHPFFWLGAAIFGWHYIDDGIQYLLIWIACVFFSILLHEFGHVWMFRAFGVHSYIVLQGICGMAVPNSRPYERWQRILVSLAGPGIQLLFVTLLLAGLYLGFPARQLRGEFLDELNFVDRLLVQMTALCYQPDFPKWLRYLLSDLVFINIFWPIFNLLPVYPLDGGQVSREVWSGIARRNGVRYSLVMSIIVCIIIAVNSFSAQHNGWSIPYVPAGGMYMVIFFAVLGVNNFLELQHLSRQRNRFGGGWDRDDGDRMPWERDADWWKR
jgi:Zn-dependent protease